MMLFQQPYRNYKEDTERVEGQTVVCGHAGECKKNAVPSKFRRKVMKVTDAVEEDVSGMSRHAPANKKAL